MMKRKGGLMKKFALCLCLVACAGITSAAIENFNGTEVNVETWVGTGSSSALLVIDFNDATDDSYFIFGYNFDGTATVRDMMDAIEASGVGLFEADGGWNNTGGESTVYGLGYDADGDGGSFIETEVGVETGYAVDADDYYAEGWEVSGFWLQWDSINGTDWTSAWGVESTTLSDGSWAGFCFDSDYSWDDEPRIPEPATMALLGFGGLVLIKRRLN